MENSIFNIFVFCRYFQIELYIIPGLRDRTSKFWNSGRRAVYAYALKILFAHHLQGGLWHGYRIFRVSTHPNNAPGNTIRVGVLFRIILTAYSKRTRGLLS